MVYQICTDSFCFFFVVNWFPFSIKGGKRKGRIQALISVNTFWKLVLELWVTCGHSMTLKLCVFIIIEILCPVDKNGHNSHFQWKNIVHTFFCLSVAVKSVLTEWVACKPTYSTMMMTTTLQNRYRNVSVASMKPAPVVLIMIVKGFCACMHVCVCVCVCMATCKWKSVCKAGVLHEHKITVGQEVG